MQAEETEVVLTNMIFKSGKSFCVRHTYNAIEEEEVAERYEVAHIHIPLEPHYPTPSQEGGRTVHATFIKKQNTNC